MVADLRYFNSLENEVDSLKSQLKTQKTQFSNEINRVFREYYYADHMNAILGVYTRLDEFTDLHESKNVCLKETIAKLQKDFSRIETHCVALELKHQNQVSKIGQHGRALKDIDEIETINIELEHSVAKLLQQNKILRKETNTVKGHYKDLYDSIKVTRNQTKVNHTYLIEQLNKKSLEITYLKAQLQDKMNVNVKIHSLLNKMKGKSMETKFEKPSVIQHPNAFKKIKDKLLAHQETISILSKQKEAQIKLYKTREDKELKKVIELENKVKVLDNIVYKTGQTVQTMNMLNNKCRTSFAKPEFLKKAQRANPRLYDIGCYNENIALMLAPDSDKVIRVEKESRSKLSDLIRPFDCDKLNNLYDLFVPQREKSSEQHKVTNLQCDYLELLEKCEGLETEFSKSKMMSKSFESVQKHAINLELELQQCQKKIKNDKFFRVNQTKDFAKNVNRIIPTTSFSRPQLKSNPMGDRVMRNNSQGKKQEVEDQRRSVKLSKNKTSVTACNDSLNAKTLNVKFVSAMCDKCLLIDKHDMCVFNSVAKPIKKTVASESNQKPRNFTRKLYEH
nr:hypothetical protein [Tanacetum cinerariifolium]